MAETFDFEANADRLLAVSTLSELVKPTNRNALKEYLVNLQLEAWNARGATDIAKLDVELSILMGSIAALPFVKHLDRALRKLDR